jgi:hypothetical protein
MRTRINAAIAKAAAVDVDGYGSYYTFHYNNSPQAPAPIEQMNNPHGIWLDMRDAAKPMLLVADRGNRRIVRYTLDDKPVDIVEGTLAPCHFHQYKGLMVVPDLQCRVTLLDQDNKVITHTWATGRTPASRTSCASRRIAAPSSPASSSRRTARGSTTPATSTSRSGWRSAG